MRRMMILGSLLLTLSTTAMASQVYKWVDDKGVTHFGANPPQGQAATSVNTVIAQPKAAAKAATPVPAAVDSGAAEQKVIDAKVKQQVAEQAAERKKYCESVRTNLAQLQNNPRLRTEVNGEQVRLGEDQRQAKIAEAQKAIKENCN
ncbi:MAG: DUF4124 domain-containing protein [Pseudomonas sp.]|uniref:DUF4124 domain-containing protein n=1 Tax=Pseudomonas sp. TaxID=306 RepID=UPI0027345484|nr:DUF4124 domain-containing protein [Pseudomonas sp.]MDP3847292.1 DUF4124 domain-containing protein [Pseudomonas sp.]